MTPYSSPTQRCWFYCIVSSPIVSCFVRSWTLPNFHIRHFFVASLEFRRVSEFVSHWIMRFVEILCEFFMIELLLAYRDELHLPRHTGNYTYIRHTCARANEPCQAEKPFDLQNWNCDTCSGPGAQQCNSSDCSEHCYGPAKQCFHANRFLDEVSYFRTYTHCGEGIDPPCFFVGFSLFTRQFPLNLASSSKV